MMDIPEQFTPKLDWRMPVEVMRDFDTVMMFGKIAAVSKDKLTIRRVSDELCFPILDLKSVALVRCYDIEMDPILLRARVASSSGIECTVEDMEWIPYKTQRKNIRYPMCPPAMISVLDGAAQEPPQLCQLLNISVSGACVVTERIYDVGQTLRLLVGLTKTEGRMACRCRVVRVTPRRGGCFEYGLLFECLSEAQTRCLAQNLQDRSYIRWP